MPKIIIGMPVYNGERFVGEAIESILAQTFGDFELYISDNASTDRTPEICLDFARRDSRIHYIRQPVNIGAMGNFNAVTQMAYAPYFKWAAHDDTLAPTFLETCVRALDANPDVVVASPATILIDEEGQSIPYSPEHGGNVDRHGICWPEMPEKNADLASLDPAERFAAALLHTDLCVEIFGLIRWPALKGILPQGSYLGSDKVLIAELCLRGRFWMGKEPLFYRRCHSQQFSAQTMRSNSGTSRAEWFSGQQARKRQVAHHILSEKLLFLVVLLRIPMGAKLTLRQRASCVATVWERALSRKVFRTISSAAIGPLQRFFVRQHREPLTQSRL